MQTKKGIASLLIVAVVGALVVAAAAFVYANSAKGRPLTVVPGKTAPAVQQLSKTDKISAIDADLSSTDFADIDASLGELDSAF